MKNTQEKWFERLRDMLEKNRDDLIRKPFSRFIAPDDQGIFMARFTAFYKNPAGKTMEIRLVHGSNSMCHARLEGRFVPLETVPGKLDIDQFCLIVSDITETKKTENKLKSYAHMLNERNKKLQCLYSISKLINDPANSLNDSFTQTITISGQDIEKIFEPFYSTRFTGSGLGLPIALGAVKTWNGCITVATTPGKGTVFNVFLPVMHTAVTSRKNDGAL